MFLKRNINKIFCSCLAFVMVAFSGCSEIAKTKNEIPKDYQADGSEYDTTIKATNDFTLVEENDRLALYVHKRCAEIKLKDKVNGREWYSNPPGRYDGAQGNISGLSSQILVQYNINDSPFTYTSYGDAIGQEQYSFSKIDNGIRVNFVMGEKRKDYVVPQLMTKERYQDIMDKLSEDDRIALAQYYELVSVNDDSMDKESKTLVLEKFPVLAKKDAYVCQLRTSITDNDASRPFANDYLMEKMEKLFEKAGYTAEQLEKDNSENQIVASMFADYSIAISVEYILDGHDLKVRIPQDSIVFDDSLLQLTQISLLPYFGAADVNQQGYILVPDGSGALIHLNNGKVASDAYSEMIYGTDWTLPYTTNTNTADSTEQLYLPVFGMKTENAAFLGIIESGETVARIDADISGKSSQYNTVGASFMVTASQSSATLSLNAQYNLFYQEEMMQTDYAVRYQFMYDDDADYTGMALIYQNYLKEKGVLNETVVKENFPLFLDILQAVDSKQTVLGMPVSRPLSLTTCDQAIEILKRLKQDGVDNIELQLRGWSNGGVRHTYMNKIRWMNDLGGKKGFFSLLDYAVNNGVTVTASCDFQYLPQPAMFDGFNASKKAARTLENVPAYNGIYAHGIVGNEQDSKGWAVVSPAHYDEIISSFLKKYPDKEKLGLALTWMGEDLNGDYRSKKMIDREAAKDKIAEQLKKLSDNGYRFTVAGANAYALEGASFVTDLTMESSENNLCDESVPFYQIVLHGYIPYSSEPLNQSSDYQYQTLKLLETGTIPSFFWMYEDNTVLKKTDYSSYYSLHYSAWLKKATQIYKIVNEALDGCYNAHIIHHEKVAKDVSKTVYDNNITVYVNYSDADKIVDGITVPAKGFFRAEVKA